MFQLNPTYGLEEMSKCEKLTPDGRTTDNRPLHKLTWNTALGELIIHYFKLAHHNQTLWKATHSNVFNIIMAHRIIKGNLSIRGSLSCKS